MFSTDVCKNMFSTDVWQPNTRYVMWKSCSLLLLGGKGLRPLCDVRPFEVNVENYFLAISFLYTRFDNFLRRPVHAIRDENADHLGCDH